MRTNLKENGFVMTNLIRKILICQYIFSNYDI